MIAKLIILLLGVTAVAAVKVCHDHKHCSGSQFCHIPTNTCAPCVDCGLYRRGEKAVGGCCKDPQECGQCLKGYTSEVLSDGSLRPLCVPLKSSQLNPAGNGLADGWPLCALIVASFIVSAAFIIGFVSKAPLMIKVRSGSFRNVTTECEAVTSNLYAPSAPAPPSYCVAEVSEEISHLCYISECTHENKQQASKYLEPQYVTAPSTNQPAGGEASLDEIDSTSVNESGEPFLFEENTLPSNWSPGPDYGEPPSEGVSQLPTSFAGILRLNSASTLSSGTASEESVNHTAEINSGSSEPSGLIGVNQINASNAATNMFNVYSGT